MLIVEREELCILAIVRYSFGVQNIEEERNSQLLIFRHLFAFTPWRGFICSGETCFLHSPAHKINISLFLSFFLMTLPGIFCNLQQKIATFSPEKLGFPSCIMTNGSSTLLHHIKIIYSYNCSVNWVADTTKSLVGLLFSSGGTKCAWV